MAGADVAPTPRRRRSPEEAEKEILDAAERLLRTYPLHEVTISAVMAETTLSRNSFYVHFHDRYDLVGRLVRRLRREANEALQVYADRESDPAVAGRESLYAVARLYVEHGPVLRALEQAARTDLRARRVWENFIRPAYDAVMERLRREAGAGRSVDEDPERLVQALLTMTRACLLELDDPPADEVERVVEALWRIWRRALYP